MISVAENARERSQDGGHPPLLPRRGGLFSNTKVFIVYLKIDPPGRSVLARDRPAWPRAPIRTVALVSVSGRLAAVSI